MKELIVVGCVLLFNIVFGESIVVNNIEWEYTKRDDGIAITKGVVPETLKRIIIPDQINGLDVVELSTSCLEDSDKIILNSSYWFNSYEQLVLPSHIKRIKSRAFFERKFYRIEFPSTLEELDQFAFGYWTTAYDNGNGTKNKPGPYPLRAEEASDYVIFWGKIPLITNQLNLEWSRSLTSYSSENYMFYSVYRVYVDEQCYGSIWQYSASEGKSFHMLGHRRVSIGFADVQISRQPQAENGYGNVVTMSSSSTNSPAIYYTLDGSNPTTKETENCFAYKGETITFDCHRTIKAIACVRSYPFTNLVVRTFGPGKAIDPVCGTSLGEEFWCSGNQLALTSKTTDATIRYTLDGSPVTEDSPIYTAPFAISDTTTVRAKAFKEDWFDSEEMVQTFTRLWYTNETPVVSAAAETFDAASQEVTLSCDTEDATIYYTIDGSEPSVENGRKYKGPFDIYETTTVKAIAVKDDWKDSAVASATFTKANAIGPAINMLEVLPDNDKTHPWTVVSDVTHDGVSAVKSGEIEDDESTTLKVTVYGAGELSFWWRTSCEPSIDGEYYDYATFYNGSTAITNLAGVTDWQQVWLNVTGTGKHTFKWTYQKDDSNSTVPDGVWLDQVQWLPATDAYYADHTLTTETPVKYNWLRYYGLGVTTDFESAAKSLSGKHDGAGRAMTVEDEFVVGTDPTNMNSRLSAEIEMVDGNPRIKWSPDLNEEGTKELRSYKIWGKEALDSDSKWEYPTNSSHHFFRVTVEMP